MLRLIVGAGADPDLVVVIDHPAHTHTSLPAFGAEPVTGPGTDDPPGARPPVAARADIRPVHPVVVKEGGVRREEHRRAEPEGDAVADGARRGGDRVDARPRFPLR